MLQAKAFTLMGIRMARGVIKIGYSLFRVIRVYFYSVHASTFNEVIYFCVQKFPPSMQASGLFMHLVVCYIWWRCQSDVCFPVISVSHKNSGQ